MPTVSANNRYIQFINLMVSNVIASKNLDENEPSFCFLLEANSTSEWMWSIYIKYMTISITQVAIAPFVSGFYCWMKGNFNVNCFFHQSKFMLVQFLYVFGPYKSTKEYKGIFFT